MATAGEVVLASPPNEFLTSEEFLDWLEPGVHADLIAGEIKMHSPASFKHALLLNLVDRVLAGYIEEKKLGQLFREVIAVKLSSRHTFLPDLCFFTNEQMKHVESSHAPFAPTVVVEAISPSSELRDRRQKFAAYEEFGVQEYWLLDPERGLHQFYRRNGDLLVPYGEIAEDRMESYAIPGFYLRRSWLNEPTLFKVMYCLQEILGSR